MQDLRAEIRFKNQRLYEMLVERLFPAGTGQPKKLCEYGAISAGVNESGLQGLLTLRISPINKRTGRWTKTAVRIAEFLERELEEVFPATLYALELPRVLVRVYDSPEVLSLQEAATQRLLPAFTMEAPPDPEELSKRLDLALRSLTPRQEKVLRDRFGIGGQEPKTLDEVGKNFAVTRARIREIEVKALSRMRHPKRAKFLKGQTDKVPQPKPSPYNPK